MTHRITSNRREDQAMPTSARHRRPIRRILAVVTAGLATTWLGAALLEGGVGGPWRGQVVDAATGHPIPGVVVRATWTRDVSGHPAIPLLPVGVLAVEERVTDAEGRFAFGRRLLPNLIGTWVTGPDLAFVAPGYGGWLGSYAALETPRGARIELRPLPDPGEQARYLTRRTSYHESDALERQGWRDVRAPAAPDGLGGGQGRRYVNALAAARTAAVAADQAARGHRPADPRTAGPIGVGVSARNDLYLSQPDRERLVVDDPGTGQRQFLLGEAGGIAVGPDAVYAGDAPTGRILRATPDGARWLDLPRVPGLPGLQSPDHLAVGPDGSLWAGDDLTGLVHRLDPDGTPRAVWGDPTRAADRWGRPGRFAAIDGLAVDAAGRVYVADGGQNRLYVMTEDGTALHVWPADQLGAPGRVLRLAGVAVFASDRILVLDRQAARVLTLDATGRVRATSDAIPGLTAPRGFAVGPDGTVYVTDARGVHRLPPSAVAGR
jgi:streptogramin lyase